jgi:hypothetical protein
MLDTDAIQITAKFYSPFAVQDSETISGKMICSVDGTNGEMIQVS